MATPTPTTIKTEMQDSGIAELLAALERISRISIQSESDPEVMGRMFNEIELEARAAIAKARGR